MPIVYVGRMPVGFSEMSPDYMTMYRSDFKFNVVEDWHFLKG